MDIHSSGGGAVAAAFANQLDYCQHNDAPITGRICAALGALVTGEDGGALLSRLRHWPGAPLADALPLRVAGGLHALHLSGVEPNLAPLYANARDLDDAALLARVIAHHEVDLLPWLDGPPQTNEAGRSANFMAAMLWLAGRGLAPQVECLEIGSSAGINLMMDRYHYDLGGTMSGPADAQMRFAPQWLGAPPPAVDITFAGLRGCDVAPVDLTDPKQALRLKAYIWPEHHVRFERMDVAIRLAAERRPALVKADAADFVEAELKGPQRTGTTRVLMHSIVWQYVDPASQARISAAMEDAGAKATADKPLAWVALEANRTVHRHELTVRYWDGGPHGGERHLLARSHAHGASIEWLAS